MSLLALSAVLLIVAASGAGGPAMSAHPLHAAFDDGAVGFFVVQSIGLRFFHGTAGLQIPFVPGLALVASAIVVATAVAARLVAGSERRKMLTALLMPLPYAVFAGIGAQLLPLHIAGPFVGRNTLVTPGAAEAFLLPLLWAALFAPIGGLIGTFGRRWRFVLSRLLGDWAEPAKASFRALVYGAGAASVVVVVGGLLLAARNGTLTFLFAGESVGHDAAVIAGVLLILPTLVLALLLACFGVSFQWHLAALSLTHGSSSIFGGSLPAFSGEATTRVPNLIALLLFVGLLTVLSAGWRAARQSDGDVRLGVAGALRAGVLLTLACWLLALVGRIDAQAGGYLGAQLQVDVASLLWRVPLVSLSGCFAGSLAYFVHQGTAARRELARVVFDALRPSQVRHTPTAWLNSTSRQNRLARVPMALAAFSLPALLVGLGSAGAGATGSNSARFSLAPITRAAEAQLRTHAEPGTDLSISVDPRRRVVDSASARIPLASLGISPHESPTAKASTVLAHYGKLFGVDDQRGELGHPEVVTDPITKTEHIGMTHVFYTQQVDGLPVFGGSIGVHLSHDGTRVDHINGAFIPEVTVANTKPTISSTQALSIAKAAQPQGKLLQNPQLEIYAGRPSDPVGATARLAWFVELTSGPLKPTTEYAIDASNGSILNAFNTAFNAVNVEIYDAEEKETLPGTKKWKTGEAESGNKAVAEAGKYVTSATEFFEKEFLKPPCNGPACNGTAAVATVNYRKIVKQAEWNTEHQEVVFGVGFQAALDVAGHEYAGGILQHTVKPVVEGEEGALMEGWADAMSKGLEGWKNRNLETNVWAEPNWEWGASAPEGAERRNLKEPSKTSDAASLAEYITKCEDLGGIHKNSTIISHAFYLLAQKIGIKEATRIFYPMEVSYRAKTFAEARKAAVEVAKLLEANPVSKEKKVAEKTQEAFKTVGLTELFIVPLSKCITESICAGKAVLTAEQPKNGTSSTLSMLTTLYRARGVLAQPSVAGKYYMPLYEANMGRITELVAHDPVLAEMTVNGLKEITPALNGLIENEGQKYKLSKAVMKEIEAALKRLAQDDRMYSGGGSLAKLIERELKFLNLPSYAGTTYSAGFKRLNNEVKPFSEKAPPPTIMVEDPECETRYGNEFQTYGFTAGTPGHHKPGEASPLDGTGLVCGAVVEKTGEPNTCSTASKNTLNSQATLELPAGDKIHGTKELANGSWVGSITGRVIGCAGNESKVGLGVTGIKSKKEWTVLQCPTTAIACYEGSARVELEKGEAEGKDYAWVKEESGKLKLTVGPPEVTARGGEKEFSVPTGFTLFKIELCALAGEPGTEKCGTTAGNWVHENGEESTPGCSNGKGLYGIQVTNVAGKTTPREQSCVYWGEELHKQAVDAGNGIAGISCIPATTDCALTDSKGNEYYSTNVTTTATATWTSWTGPSTAGEAISCPTTALCALADGKVKTGGNVYYATSLGGTWSTAFEPANGALSMSCPTSSFCVAGLENGEIRYSTKPASTSWTGITIGSGTLNGMSCLSSSFCAAVNSAGHVYIATSEAKVKEASGWKSTEIDGSTALHGIACTTTTSCIAVDSAGNILDLTINGGGEATVTKHDVDGANNLTGIACTEEIICVAVDSAGNVLVSSSLGQAWRNEHALGKNLTSISCASSRLCATADTEGNVTAFTPIAVPANSNTQMIDAGNSVNAVACVPSVSDCVVGDSKGNAYYSTNVTALTPATWTSWTGPAAPSEAVACPTTTVCILADGVALEGGGGNLSYATSLGGAWKEAFSPAFGVTSASCGSASLCVTGDSEGFVRYSTKPASTEWEALEIGPGATMNAVSCLSAAFCVAVDSKGNIRVANTEAKIKEETGWKATNVDGTKPLHGVACTSTTSCLAVDGEGHVLRLTIKIGGEATAVTETLDGTNNLTGIACSGSTCVAVDNKGNVFDTTNAGTSWKTEYALGNNLTSVACSATTLCIAASTTGEVTTLRPE